MVHLWKKYRVAIIDFFVISNLAFLAVDIYFAHSINHFDNLYEWIPFVFSLSAPPILIVSLLMQSRGSCLKFTSGSILFVGCLSIVIGIAGLFFHLKSQFFEGMSIESLVYTAPFMAPLAYSGLGFLILLNRKVSADKVEWGQWIIFFALGGFLGNFILSLCDHAQNGFFYVTEWIPVVISAYAIGFLFTFLIAKVSKVFIRATYIVLIMQVLIGILGFYFHLKANLTAGIGILFDNFIYGAPIFAPLLFVDVAVLAAFGVYDLQIKSLKMTS